MNRWRSAKRNSIASSPVRRGSAAMSKSPTCNSSTPCCRWRNIAAKWRGLPKRYGPWQHHLSTRMNRWSKNGVLDQVFEKLGASKSRMRIQDRSRQTGFRHRFKAHPEGTGALKNGPPAPSEEIRGGWTTKIHMVAADARTAITFNPLARPSRRRQGRAAPCWRGLGPLARTLATLIMEWAYEDGETRQLALDFEALFPWSHPKAIGCNPGSADKAMYRKRRNEAGEALPPPQRLPPNLLPLAAADCTVPGFPDFHPDRGREKAKTPSWLGRTNSFSSPQPSRLNSLPPGENSGQRQSR